LGVCSDCGSFCTDDAKESMMRTEKMIEEMGNFNEINPENIPKRVSRIGLCFSTTYPVFDVRFTVPFLIDALITTPNSLQSN
jgi:hypothetical protein